MDNLKVGLIAEGKSDLAVLYNILECVLGIERSQIKPIAPDLYADETYINKTEIEKNAFSNWTIVKQHCKDKEEIDRFFNENPLGQDLILIIQIDTEERNLKGYEVAEPAKSKTKKYSEILRENVIQKIEEWLEIPYDNILYAITIEETEAWLLALHPDRKNDTADYNDVKAKLFSELNKRLKKKEKNILKQKDAFVKYDTLSKSLGKQKVLKTARTKNRSLDLFCASLEENLVIEN